MRSRFFISHSGPSEDTLAAYRLMGLDLDATYDEIEAAFNDLTAQYAGDAKRKIKLSVAKDKILDDRLRQRMSGGLQGFTGVKDPFDVPEGPKPLIKIPRQLEGVMELPEKEVLLKNIGVFLVIGLLPLPNPGWVSASVSFGFAISLFLLYNRGVEMSGEMGAEMRQYKAKPLLLAVGITLLCAMISASLFQAIGGILLGFLSQEVLIGLGASFGFFTACTLFKVQDD